MFNNHNDGIIKPILNLFKKSKKFSQPQYLWVTIITYSY